VIAVVVAGVVIGLVIWALIVLNTAPSQEDLGFTDPPSLLDDLDTDEGTPW
jgi:hypothetical protein